MSAGGHGHGGGAWSGHVMSPWRDGLEGLKHGVGLRGMASHAPNNTHLVDCPIGGVATERLGHAPKWSRGDLHLAHAEGCQRGGWGKRCGFLQLVVVHLAV